MLVFQDLLDLANHPTDFSQLSNPELLWFLADPLTSPDPYNGGVADGAAAVATNGIGNFDPQFSTDLSTLLASLGTTAGSDALSAALAEISAQISADLATFVPQSVLGMF